MNIIVLIIIWEKILNPLLLLQNSMPTKNTLDWSKLDPEGERLWAEGSKLEDEGKLELAAEAYLAAANLGDPLAQVNLANILDNEFNGPLEAVYWYKRAVKFGYPAAVLYLSAHYKNLGIHRWYVYWLNMAANMGDEWAAIELASLGQNFTLGRSAD